MILHEKPKREPLLDSDELAPIVRQFYWQLFKYLMVPALALGLIFWTPSFLLGRLPDRLNAQCTVRGENDLAVRIISETRQLNEITIYWSNDGAATWQEAYNFNQAYRTAKADCNAVRFLAGGTSTIDLEGIMVVIEPDGSIQATRVDS